MVRERCGEFSIDEFDVQGASVSSIEVVVDFVIRAKVFFALLDELIPDVPGCDLREDIVLLLVVDLAEVISDLFVETIPGRRFITKSLVVIVVIDLLDVIFDVIFFDLVHVCSSISGF